MATFRLAPQTMLLSATLVVLLALAVNIYMTLRVPWLGIEFAPAEHGLRVAGVNEAHPNHKTVTPDTVFAGIRTSGDVIVPLSDQTLIEEPDVLESYAAFNRFFEQQTALFQALKHPPVTAVTDSGGEIHLATLPARSPLSLGFPYWSQLLFGSAALLIGIGVWGFSNQTGAARLLATVGACLFLQLHVAGYYGARELAIDGNWFQVLSVINHLGASYMIASFTGLLWIYPQRLALLPVVPMLFAAATLVILLSALQVLSAPYHAVYALVTVGVAAAWIFVLVQRRRARNRPADRAAISWFVLLVLVSSGVFTAFIIIPVLVGGQPLAPQWLMYLTACVFHLGLALAITRYRLFELEQWWFRAWAWFFGGVAVIAIDLILFVGFGLRQAVSAAVALALIGWLYFPIRQRIWERLHPGSARRVESILPGFASRLFAVNSLEQVAYEWEGILREVFTPLEMKTDAGMLEDIEVSNDGMTLLVPGIAGDSHISISYPDAGARLFRPQDLELVRVLMEFAHRARNALQARNQGALQERKRIMRDLHDDLGAKLLTLVYSTREKETKDLGKSALQDLRTVISALSGEGCSLKQAVEQWRQEFDQRLKAAGIGHRWSMPESLPDIRIDARTRINLSRILREIVSNAIKHGDASQVTLSGNYDLQSGLTLCIEDDGKGFDPAGESERSGGEGMKSMQLRADDIQTRLTWDSAPGQGCKVIIVVPVSVMGTMNN